MTARELESKGFVVTGPLLGMDDIDNLAAALARVPRLGAGTRNMLAIDWCRDLAGQLMRHPAIAAALPADPVAVQCNYFKKYKEQNWLVPAHQDLSIPVKARVDHPELAGWSEKEGHLYVQPPAAVMEALVGVRLHIDDCGPDDGPLRVVPGSHRGGRLGAGDILMARARAGEVDCIVARGAALVLKPLIIHSSAKVKGHNPRRVLHFVFGPATLPFGLQWLHAHSPTTPEPCRQPIPA